MALPSASDTLYGSRSPSQSDSKNSAEVRGRPPYRPISPALAIAPTVSVIIPARNEAANLPHVFGTLPPWVDEVVLVDGHSVDDTVAVTRALCPRAKVVSQPGTGKGDALRTGFAAATGDILVTIDADGSTDGSELIRFVSALVAGADFAKGSRFSSSGGSDDITGVRRYGNRLLSVLVNWMFQTHFTDLCYGYNAFWARHLDAMEVSSSPGFEVETLMSIRAAKAGLKIHEVPSHECPRIFGASNLRAVRDGWRILKVIVREWLRGPRKQGSRELAAAPAPGAGVTGGLAVAPCRVSGHDREGIANEREIVAAITAGDATGMAAAFDWHAQGLYTYCRSRLAAPADAADAVLATFVVASAEASRLSQTDRLRAWLFAVARNECHRRLRAAAPSARLYEAASAMDDAGTFAACTEQAQTRAMVRAALAGMDPVDRDVSELNLRHGFYGADLADLLGAPRNRAHALASRARSRFERSLGVLLMARIVREHCPELAAILDGERGRSTLPPRWRVWRHIGCCEVCGERRRSGLNPAILLNLLPAIPLPTDLRRKTLDLVLDESPAAATYRAQVLDRAVPLGAGGFPVQRATPPSAPGWLAGSVSAAAAAAAAAVLLGGAVYHAHHPSGRTRSVVPAVRRLPPPGPEGSGAAGRTPAVPQATSGPPAAHRRSLSPARSLSPSHSPSPAPAPSPSCSPSPSPAKAGRVLIVDGLICIQER